MMKSASEIIDKINEDMAERLILEIKSKINIFIKMHEPEKIKSLTNEIIDLKKKLSREKSVQLDIESYLDKKTTSY